jgi:hypothetical protein
MEISKAEAAEIAAECVASIEYQTNNIALTARSDAMSTADMAAAVMPKKPATLRLIEWDEARRAISVDERSIAARHGTSGGFGIDDMSVNSGEPFRPGP